MAALVSQPSTASHATERNSTAPVAQRHDSISPSVSRNRHLNKSSTSRAMHRSVPPVHELTSYNIGYKPKGNIIRYQRSAPAPTNMTYLPSAQEKLLQNRKLLAKVVGFDSSLLEQQVNKTSKTPLTPNNTPNFVEDTLSPRYSNAFASARSPRGVRSSLGKEMEMSRSEILKGHGLPATPRLLRGADSKNYGIRRQISASNQLELSPDFGPGSAARKSAIHFNTPAGEQSNLHTPADNENAAAVDSPTKSEEKETVQSRESQYAGQLVSPFGQEGFEVTKTALTNSMTLRDRNRNVPWVYCYKVKRDRLKLSQLLTTKSPTDPAVDELLPAF